jgi:hypothetical protein
MTFHIFVTIIVFGFAILLGILDVMRGLYRSSMFEAPEMPGDSAAAVSLDDCNDQALSCTGALVISIDTCSAPRTGRLFGPMAKTRR